jgi:hypothetical protein
MPPRCYGTSKSHHSSAVKKFLGERVLTSAGADICTSLRNIYSTADRDLSFAGGARFLLASAGITSGDMRMGDKTGKPEPDATSRGSHDAATPKRSESQSAPKKTRSAFARHSPTSAPQPDTEPREGEDERLDEALKESFPASDPLPINPGPERCG